MTAEIEESEQVNEVIKEQEGRFSAEPVESAFQLACESCETAQADK